MYINKGHLVWGFMLNVAMHTGEDLCQCGG